MADHLSAELLEGYHQRRLEPAQLLAIDDHVTTCSECREILRRITPRHDALVSLRARLETTHPAEEHLADDRLQAYVEDRLDAVDRELAESHLENCQLCRAQAERFPALVRPTGKLQRATD